MNQPTLRSVLAAFVALIVIALAGDQLLELGLASQESTGDVDLLDGESLTRQLEYAAAARGRSILLIGDSVLAGDVLASHTANWRSQRVLDFMRNQSHADAGVAIHQVALDALLPIDVERVVAELDRVDPGGRVEVVIELNLRIFSPHYREAAGCTRDLICASPNLAGESSAPAFSWAGFVDRVRDATPIWRHRDRFEGAALVPTLDAQIDERRQRGDAAPRDALLAQARIEDHYRVDPAAASNDTRSRTAR